MNSFQTNRVYLSMKRLMYFLSLVFVSMMVSCNGQKRIVYFQDMPAGTQDTIQDTVLIRLQVSDKVNIHVAARDAEISNLFNIAGAGSILTSSSTSSYVIDSHGDITFPVLGKIHVAGMTREELTEHLVDILEDRQLIKDPVVTVDFNDLSVTVLGESATGKRLYIHKDYYTLLDAMADMGDLQISGVRETVKVLRNDNGIVTAYNVNLTSAQDIYASPVYYLQQNDVIYIAPSKKKSREYYDNASMLVSPTFWTGIVTSALSLTSVTIALTRTASGNSSNGK